MSVKGVSVQLFDANGAAIASTSGIEVLWFDADTIPEISQLNGSNGVVATDGSGWINLDLSKVTGLAVGEWGFLVCYKQDGGDYRSSPVFMSQMQVASIASGDLLNPVTRWTRNPSWLALPDVTGLQKFAGLYAIYPHSNFIALSAAGNFTVDWGDGTGGHNISSGVTAETNLDYTLYAASSDVGIATAQACTFTDSSNKVNLTAHGFLNGQEVSFDTITSTTGISTHTYYYVVSTATNDFQVALTPRGAAINLVTDGSGTVYIPQYRQAIVTVVPNGGNITSLNLNIKNSTTGLPTYSSGWLDVAVSAQYMTEMRFGVSLPGQAMVTINQNCCEQVSILSSDLRQMGYFFFQCQNLKNIDKLVTGASARATGSCTFTDAGDLVTATAHGFRVGDPIIFTSITSTTGIVKNTNYWVINANTNDFQVANTYGGAAIALTTNGSGTYLRGVSFASAFNKCQSLKGIPIFDTSQAIDVSRMFYICYSLETVPKLDFSNCVLANYICYNCFGLYTVPVLDFSAAVTLASAFISCDGLSSIKLITSACTDFSSIFSNSSSLKSVSLSSTAAGTIFSNMFSTCLALTSGPPLDTAAGTDFGSMFNSCTALVNIPAYDFRAVSTLSSIFNSCTALHRGVLDGNTKTISYANGMLSAEELDAIYTALGTGTSQTITVTGNWGVATDTPSIATAKGWTVTG
jgi:hypothetical protein